MYLINPEDIRFEMRPIMPFLSGNPVQYEWIAFREEVNQIPMIEAEPVKHAHWIPDERETGEGSNTYKCSACGEIQMLIEGTPNENGWKYCPNCGAKMVEYEDYESESGEGENHDND